MDLKHLKVWLEQIALDIEDAHEVDCDYIYDYYNKHDKYDVFNPCDCRVERAKATVLLILNKVEKELENVK